MRINVYSEELTDKVDLVMKDANGHIFYGVRFVLKTHEDMLPPKHGDDDSSAVTFWSEDLGALNTLFALATDKTTDWIMGRFNTEKRAAQ